MIYCCYGITLYPDLMDYWIIPYALLKKDGVSKTARGETLKRLLLYTTPCLKTSGKARRKWPKAITEGKAFPAPVCTRAYVPKASPTSPTPPSAKLEIILKYGRSSQVSVGAFSRRCFSFE